MTAPTVALYELAGIAHPDVDRVVRLRPENERQEAERADEERGRSKRNRRWSVLRSGESTHNPAVLLLLRTSRTGDCVNTTAELEWGLDKIGTPTEPKRSKSPKSGGGLRGGDQRQHQKHASGELAPAVFSIVPAFESLIPSLIGIVPNEVLMTAVHGEQDIRFHQPIMPGQTLVSAAGRRGSRNVERSTTVIKATTETQSGEPSSSST